MPPPSSKQHYLHWMAEVQVGDLHPGGVAASERLRAWCTPWFPGPAWELGPGLGLTLRRWRAEGWDITGVEPDPVLRRRAESSGLAVVAGSGEALPEGQPRLILSESVLGVCDLGAAVRSIAARLSPGGALALCELVWRSGTPAEVATRAHDDSLARFGIPVATREPLCWTDWVALLHAAGLTQREHLALDPASGTVPPPQWRHPLLAWRLHRAHRGQYHVPSGSLEAHAGLFVRTG